VRHADAVNLVIKELDPSTRAISVLTPAVAGATDADTGVDARRHTADGSKGRRCMDGGAGNRDGQRCCRSNG
jgi:hypothetical protein